MAEIYYVIQISRTPDQGIWPIKHFLTHPLQIGIMSPGTEHWGHTNNIKHATWFTTKQLANDLAKQFLAGTKDLGVNVLEIKIQM